MKNICLLFITLFIFIGCRSVDESVEPQNYPVGSFQITLKATGEIILDDTHLSLYEVDSLRHILHLNAAGLAKIRSFVKWDSTWNPPIPKLGYLYKKDFSVKFDGKELYSGQFYSLVSSSFSPGFVILDILMITSSDYLTIEMGYPSSKYFEGTDARNNKDLFDYLKSKGKFKKTN